MADSKAGRTALCEFHEAQAFFAERIETNASLAFLAATQQKQKPKARQRAALEKRGKLLMYNKLSSDLQKLLDTSRLKEWNNYKKFGAAKIISRQEAERLVGLGAEELPTQWIERDKNEFKRTEETPDIEPEMKSRLVARGDLSKIWSRSDSPTADKESVFLVLSFAASRRLMINSGDLDHGYFQGEKLAKPLVLRQPAGGLPDDVQPDDRMLAFVPIYGTKDAGRGLWRRIRKVFISVGLRENFVMSALYSYSKDGVAMVLVATHVDDVLWACDPEASDVMKAVTTELAFGTLEERSFRFCGVEIQQDDDFTIRVTCEKTSRKLELIDIPEHRSKDPTSPCTANEQEALRSVTGGLMWITRSCRPGIAYGTSVLQSAVNKPLVEDLLYANKIVSMVHSTATLGLVYRPGGVCWPTRDTIESGIKICIAAVSDASHGSEDEWLDEWQEREPFRSQGAKVLFIADIAILDQDEGAVHLVSFASTTLKRVVSSTMKAESYQLTEVVEGADLMRAALADCHGSLDHNDWETSASQWCISQWSTDCRSCADTLKKPVNKGIDKRLGIELASLRQYLWRKRGEPAPDKRLLEELPPMSERTDVCRWIDTTVMAADCLTKLMKEDFLQDIIESNIWNSAQTASAKATKVRKAEGSHRRKQERRDAEVASDDDHAG